MAKLETVAVLLDTSDPKIYRAKDGRLEEMYVDGHWERADPPAYDTDANASRELLAYVKAKERETPFGGNVLRIVAPSLNIGAFPVARVFELLSATPQQIYAAFCATFARELNELEKRP